MYILGTKGKVLKSEGLAPTSTIENEKTLLRAPYSNDAISPLNFFIVALIVHLHVSSILFVHCQCDMINPQHHTSRDPELCSLGLSFGFYSQQTGHAVSKITCFPRCYRSNAMTITLTVRCTMNSLS